MKRIPSTDYGVATAEMENRDCTVRALANAADMPYQQAHALLKKHGRKDRRGAYFHTMMEAYKEAGFVVRSLHGTTGSARYASRLTKMKAQEGITLERVLDRLSVGEFIVNVTGHALAVVNGKIIDTFDNPAGKRVVAIFEKI